MFVSNNRKNWVAPGPKRYNSCQQFVAAVNAKFETAENLLHRNYSSGKPLKQTKLPIGYFFKQPRSEDRFNTTLLPLPQPIVQIKGNLNKTIDIVVKNFHEDLDVQNKNSPVKEFITLSKNGKNKMALMGRVDFCLKMRKIYPTLDALWDVYGQLKKIIKGKQRGENVLLLRNSDGGPILQSIYYDFTLVGFDSGCYLRAVGRFIADNRLQTFKLQRIEEEEYMNSVRYFNRIQNVSSFALLQRNSTN